MNAPKIVFLSISLVLLLVGLGSIAAHEVETKEDVRLIGIWEFKMVTAKAHCEFDGKGNYRMGYYRDGVWDPRVIMKGKYRWVDKETIEIKIDPHPDEKNEEEEKYTWKVRFTDDGKTMTATEGKHETKYYRMEK